MKKVMNLIGCLVIAMTVTAQVEVTTASGQRVLLNEDGTWEYVAIEEIEVAFVKELTGELTCDDVLLVTEDRVTGVTIVSTKEGFVLADTSEERGLGIIMMQSDRGLIWNTRVMNRACVDDKQRMNILFRDGSRLELVNDGKFNCQGDFTLYFGGVFGKGRQLKQLQEKEIETIRVGTRTGFAEQTLTEYESAFMKKAFGCIVKK